MSTQDSFKFELSRFTLSSCGIERLPAMSKGFRKGWALNFKANAKLNCWSNHFLEPSISMLTALNLDIFYERRETKKTKSAEEALVTMEFHFISFFEFQKGSELPTEQEFYQQFALGKGVNLSHPYIQEFVVNMTNRLGFPPLMLGLSNISFSYLD